MTVHCLSIVALILSAGFWLWSAFTKIPKRVDVSFSGTGEDVDRLVKALRRQSYLNAIGAIFAGIGVVLSAFA